jgi:hypothetical protein
MEEHEIEVLDGDYSDYSTLDNLKEKLEELRNLKFPGLTKEEIAKIFFGYLKALPCLTGMYAPEKFNAFNFYRVRLGVNPESEDISLIRTFSYPSSHFCSENGRANLKNKSVFYCSNSALTSVMESKPNIGDVGYLSIWKGKTNRVMKAGLFLPEDLRIENEWRAVCDDLYKHVRCETLKSHPEKYQFFHETLRFISRLYLDENKPYYLTSWISDQMFHGLTWNDFIVYPSYSNSGYSCNMAIHPNIVDNYLEFKKVIRFKIQNKAGNNWTISTGHFGEVKNTNIEWKMAAPNELDFNKLPL